MRYVSWICVCWYAYHIINLTLEGLEKVEFKIAGILDEAQHVKTDCIFNLFWSCYPDSSGACEIGFILFYGFLWILSKHWDEFEKMART